MNFLRSQHRVLVAHATGVLVGASFKAAAADDSVAQFEREERPPKGERLDPKPIAMLKRWIDLGAHWSASRAANEDGAPPASAAIDPATFMAKSAHLGRDRSADFLGRDRSADFFGFAGHHDPVAFRAMRVKKL